MDWSLWPISSKGFYVNTVATDNFADSDGNWRCMQCNKVLAGFEPEYCCGGRDCGCMGQNTNMPVCNEECYQAWYNKRLRVIPGFQANPEGQSK